MGFDKPYFHTECGTMLDLEQEADEPEMSFWYCSRCDVFTNEIKTIET